MATNSITLNELNPYSTGYIIKLEEGKEILKRDKLSYEFAVTRDRTHTVIEGEKLFDIAFRRYQNSRLVFLIADANGILNPFELTTGEDLIIPDLDKFRLQQGS
jgi:nucleoid-associated protein YgaU